LRFTEVDVSGLLDPLFTDAKITSPSLSSAPEDQTSHESHDLAAIKTYRYLRIGMLVAVVGLTYSVLEEYFKPGVGCFLGSLSGYYYTPVHSVFISVLVAVGLALIVIKGRTALEDVFLSLAGVMAPIVAFLPTTDDPNGACRPQMLQVGNYLPVVKPFGSGSSKLDKTFSDSSILNNLHALVFAGFAAIVLVGAGVFIQSRLNSASMTEYTKGTRNNFIIGVVIVGTIWGLIEFDYKWVYQQHAKAACAMFVFIAAAALTNCVVGSRKMNKTWVDRFYVISYGAIGILMLSAGAVFLIFYYELGYRSWLGGHLVLAVETVGFLLFFIYWAVQTVERWNETVLPKNALTGEDGVSATTADQLDLESVLDPMTLK
jgi:hypothetical protein